MAPTKILPYVENQLWIKEHPIKFGGFSFFTRMTIVRLMNGELFIHSPVDISLEEKMQLTKIGNVRYIVAPSKLHHVFVEPFAEMFPHAKTYGTVGLQKKRKEFSFSNNLTDTPPDEWSNEIDQTLFGGNATLEEVEFYHKPSKTLILTDLIEYFPCPPKNANLFMKLMLFLFPRFKSGCASPEFAMFTRNKHEAALSLRKILAWDFERAIIAHGNLPGNEIRGMIEKSYKKYLVDQEKST